MERLKIIEHPCMMTELADNVFRKYDQMSNLITDFEKKVYTEWVAGVDSACSFNQDQPVLIRAADNVLSVNFDRALTTVLREVKYLNYLKREDIPESASKLY
jgi:dynein heavy chain